MRDRQQFIRDLLSQMTVDYLFAQYLVCLLFDSLRLILGVHCQKVIEEIEQNSIVLLFAGIIRQQSQ